MDNAKAARRSLRPTFPGATRLLRQMDDGMTHILFNDHSAAHVVAVSLHVKYSGTSNRCRVLSEPTRHLAATLGFLQSDRGLAQSTTAPTSTRSKLHHLETGLSTVV